MEDFLRLWQSVRKDTLPETSDEERMDVDGDEDDEGVEGELADEIEDEEDEESMEL